MPWRPKWNRTSLSLPLRSESRAYTFIRRFCLALVLAATILGSPRACWAEPEAASSATRTDGRDEWRVATRVVPPLVIDTDEGLSGFSIDLWNAIAKDLGVRTRFVRVDRLPELFETISAGRADLAVAAISITSEREQRFDFSVTMLEAGLRIAVPPASGSTSAATLHALRALLHDPALKEVLAAIAALVLLVATVVWWFERRHPEGMTAEAAPAHGYGHAIWWTLSSLAAQADEMPRSPFGRAVAVVWLFACIALITWFTAGLASTVTIDRLRGEINGPQDLPGRRVGTIAHSTAAAYLADHFATPVPFATLEEACAALEQGKVEAVVYDAPALSYYATHAGHDRVRMVGTAFHRQAYGILFAPNDARRKRVNRALLALREDGRYDAIYARWFGPDSGESQSR